jgi:hypothetical protein
MGETHSNADVHDRRDANSLLSVLSNEVVPMYYERDGDGLPREWISRMKRAIRTLGWRFSADAMVMDYVQKAVYSSGRRHEQRIGLALSPHLSSAVRDVGIIIEKATSVLARRQQALVTPPEEIGSDAGPPNHRADQEQHAEGRERRWPSSMAIQVLPSQTTRRVLASSSCGESLR